MALVRPHELTTATTRDQLAQICDRSEIVGVTGTREQLSHAQEALVSDLVYRLDPNSALVWGACVGVDVIAAAYAEMYSIPNHAVLPPDHRLVAPDWWDYATTYEQIPIGPDGYKRRNQRIVDLSDRLIAFPQYPEDHPQSHRSGSWQTVRMARRKGIPVDVYVLSEVR